MNMGGISDTQPNSGLRLVRWTMWSFSVVVIVALIAGIAATLIGGSFTDLGSGAGGLFGIPSILTTLTALVLATPAAMLVARHTGETSGWLTAAL